MVKNSDEARETATKAILPKSDDFGYDDAAVDKCF